MGVAEEVVENTRPAAACIKGRQAYDVADAASVAAVHNKPS